MHKKNAIMQEQVESYKKNGYVVISDVFTEAECDNILRHIRQHAEKDFAAIMNPDRADFLKKQDPDGDDATINETARLMRDVMTKPRVRKILETLQGKEVVGLMSQMLFKEAGTAYASQAWNPHQDNTYPRNKNKQYITTNLFLADADRENGTLYIYPGSHEEDLLPAKPTISYQEQKGTNPGNTIEVPDKYEKVDVTFKKGDLLVLNGNTMHGSYPNNSNRSRPLYSCSYITNGESFIPGKSAQRVEIPLQ